MDKAPIYFSSYDLGRKLKRLGEGVIERGDCLNDKFCRKVKIISLKVLLHH